MKFRVTSSDGGVSTYDEDDPICLILRRQFATPKLCYNKSRDKYLTKVYDLEKFYMKSRSWSCKIHPDAEKKAHAYFNTLPQYDESDLGKYVIDIPIKEVWDHLVHFQDKFRLYNRPLEYKYQEVPIDPYIFGVWLGDGWSNSSNITNVDLEIISAYTKYCESLGLSVEKWGSKGIQYRCYKPDYKNQGFDIGEYKALGIISDLRKGFDIDKISKTRNIPVDTIKKYNALFVNKGEKGISDIYRHNTFFRKLNALRVLNDKHIPDIYFENSYQIRLEVLAGFIDTDGSLNKGTNYDISQGLKNEKVFDDIKQLAESLGFRVTKKYCVKTCLYKGKKVECPAVRGSITGDIHLIPVKVEKKKCVKIKTQRYDFLKFDVEKIA